MSYFSEALDAHMQANQLTNLGLASVSDELNDSEISRWRRGAAHPTDRALARLLRHLPGAVAVQLCIAWLRDETPEEMRPKIVIQPAVGQVAVDLTREDWQQAMEYFDEMGRHNPLIRETLVGLHRLLTQAPEPVRASPGLYTQAAEEFEVEQRRRYGSGGDDLARPVAAETVVGAVVGAVVGGPVLRVVEPPTKEEGGDLAAKGRKERKKGS